MEATNRLWDTPRSLVELLLTTREAAERLGVHERTVRRAIARGDLPAQRRGGTYSIAVSALEAYALAHPVAQLVALPTTMAGMTPLPASLSPFIGRQEDLAAVTALLQDPAVRLLTLTGPGSIGKTRLAIEAATTTRASFPDGVVFVSLAAVSRAELVVSAIADAMGLREVGRRDMLGRIRGVLRARRLLLLLDNFEQLLGAAPILAEMLIAAPDVTMIVTSRAPLHLSGEREWPVPPLTLPQPDVPITEEVLLTFDAARLFIARTQANDPAFVVNDASAPVVAAICQRLDGLPLAIELAAARTKLLPPSALLQRLAPSLPFLVDGPRDLPTRQRTLRHAIAWSYDLLSPEEQALFRRLAVFVGGFTLDAVEAISYWPLAIGSEDDAGRASAHRQAKDLQPTANSQQPLVFDLVNALHEQNLLVREEESGDRFRLRLRMLETIREFGLERLAEAGEEQAARAAHASYFHALAQSLAISTLVGGTAAPFDQLTSEDANLQSALSWLDESGPAAEFAQLAAALQGYWCAVSHYREGKEWLKRALVKSESASLVDRARVLAGLGRLAVFQGDHAAAAAHLTAALPLLREAAGPLETSIALIACGAEANQAGDYDGAEAILEEALAFVSERDEPAYSDAAANALANLGVTARGRGDLAAAARWHEAALARFQRHGHERGVLRTRVDLGDLARDQGKYQQAVVHYRAFLAGTGEWVDMRRVADTLAGIASAAAAWGLAPSAARLFGAAEALRERVGVALLVPADLAAEQRGIAAMREGLAEPHLTRYWAEGRSLSPAAVAAAVAAVSEAMGESDEPHGVSDLSGWTARELDVLRLIVAQLTDREIAETLFLSRRTVSWYVTRILGKLGVRSRRQAAAVAVADGLMAASTER